jgi:hypothetical protein
VAETVAGEKIAATVEMWNWRGWGEKKPKKRS